MAVAERKILEAQARGRGQEDRRLRQVRPCGNGYLELFNDTVKKQPRRGRRRQAWTRSSTTPACASRKAARCRPPSASTSSSRSASRRASRLAKALARLGNVYARVAFYDKASSNFEEYARKYAGEDDAYKAMNDAVFYRKGLGDDDKRHREHQLLHQDVRQEGQAVSRTPPTPSSAWRSIYEKRGDLDIVVDHYRRYLKQYGDKGGGDEIVLAYGRIGQILWEQSCPVKTVDGSCIKIVRERAVGTRAKKRRKGDATRTQCGPETKIKLTVVDARREEGEGGHEGLRLGHRRVRAPRRQVRRWRRARRPLTGTPSRSSSPRRGRLREASSPQVPHRPELRSGEAQGRSRRLEHEVREWLKEKAAAGGKASARLRPA